MSVPLYPEKTDLPGLFGPDDFLRYHYRGSTAFPDRYIIIYDPGLLKRITGTYGPRKLERAIPGADLFCLGETGIAAMRGVGGPHCAAALEELICLGAGRFLSIGTAGGLQTRGFFLCEKALRDEGTSYHYLPPERFAYPDRELTAALESAMRTAGIDFERTACWTTDAPYRETRAEAEQYRRQGIAAVEMENASLFAVARFRQVKIAAACVISDVLDHAWEPGFHHADTKKGLDRLFAAALTVFAPHTKD